MDWNNRKMKNIRLRCCASPFVVAAYYDVRLIPQDLHALHSDIFDLPVLSHLS